MQDMVEQAVAVVVTFILVLKLVSESVVEEVERIMLLLVSVRYIVLTVVRLILESVKRRFAN